MTIMIQTFMAVEKKKNGYTNIPVFPETLNALAELMPKSWDWDRCIKELTEMWKNQQRKSFKSGKPSEDNQTS